MPDEIYRCRKDSRRRRRGRRSAKLVQVSEIRFFARCNSLRSSLFLSLWIAVFRCPRNRQIAYKDIPPKIWNFNPCRKAKITVRGGCEGVFFSTEGSPRETSGVRPALLQVASSLHLPGKKNGKVVSHFSKKERKREKEEKEN